MSFKTASPLAQVVATENSTILIGDAQLPRRRMDLVIRILDDTGRVVVKNPASGEFFQIGEQAHFLLIQLDGSRSPCDVGTAFAERFGDTLSDEDLNGFLEMAASQGLLETADDPERPVPLRSNGQNPTLKQNILRWRKPFFDLDRLFNCLEPRIRFLWTPAFLILSASSIVLATLLVWTNTYDLQNSFKQALIPRSRIWLLAADYAKKSLSYYCTCVPYLESGVKS